ncbi:toll/interleukin-1 receptor domain-containing protein [Pseudomonas huanghezhanensis]|uniref:toll/interleukin-1 receptor domain-containing protein n=1 Tax=Pseudomonas huanghezhanensis TaxID=3002903 RepID=UPI0022861204|nr:toll/interleukin-1 receptor domain-containing protein [Pseudomonas sp. BSw22131]
MLKVFLSYTKVDHEKVEPFFHRLTHEGFDPWLDNEKLLPGHNWSYEIDQALAEANVVMLFEHLKRQQARIRSARSESSD